MIGYAVIVQLIAAGLFGGAVHAWVTRILGLTALVISLTAGTWVNALGPPYIGTQTFLWVIYILNARASTFLSGAEALVIAWLAANAWGMRSYIPLLNSRSKFLIIAGWVLLCFFSVLAVAVTAEKRPWGFLQA